MSANLPSDGAKSRENVEFLSLLAENERVLSSHSFIRMSPEFEKFETLTPPHFMTERPINSISKPKLDCTSENRL